ncbi:ArdC family protein [Longimicrobium sp.]|uniref:ArdC family protein n=1 Tax=Longimicrobium sp. TaxID=2029185 RepID=UPI002E2FCF43|nr:zincin-like metallopeptidase domain-containing protein [Longimicrobium sp.]HEX6039511.1 zincin-like metallopeptidase domain-containing protein [Longimicrobium sp.]
MPSTNHQPRDIYQEVTDRIVAALETGVAPWVRPWRPMYAANDFPRNGLTGRPYHGINVFLLWLTANACGYRSQDWFTFNQAKQKGAHVRKGERGTLVTFWKLLRVRDDAAEAGTDRTKKIPLLRHFIVFNRDQLDGLPAVKADPAPQRPEWERDEAVETFVRASGARIIEGGSHAAYSPGRDEIYMPPLADFVTREAYYSTELHELTHWTGHGSRMNRDLSGGFGSESYAREELVAEMGAAFLCAALGVQGQLQHPEYIGNWIQVLKGDKKAVFRAASEARQVAEYLGATPPAAGQTEEDEGEGAAELPEAA